MKILPSVWEGIHVLPAKLKISQVHSHVTLKQSVKPAYIIQSTTSQTPPPFPAYFLHCTACSLAVLPESWGFMTSGSSGGLEKGSTLSCSNASSEREGEICLIRREWRVSKGNRGRGIFRRINLRVQGSCNLFLLNYQTTNYFTAILTDGYLAAQHQNKTEWMFWNMGQMLRNRN